MPTTPPSITALPAPPDPNDRATFNTRAYPWSVAQQTLATEVGAVATNVFDNATEAATAASTAATQAGLAATSKTNADAAAALANNWATKTDGPVSGGEYSAKKYAQDAAATVATIPEGTINDATTSLVSVWSSTKVAAEIAGIPTGSSLTRSARTSNTILGTADKGTLIDITSGTFSQTFDAVATLGDGWWCYLRNSGTGDITIDPDSTELIDGLSSYVMYPGEVRLVQCDGTALRSVVVQAAKKVFTASGAFVVPPGIKSLLVDAAGGGGGGSRTQTTSRSRGNGGGGGGRSISRIDVASLTVGGSISVTVGAGGLGATSDNTYGSSGGASSFGSLVSAQGGAASNQANAGGAGGAGARVQSFENTSQLFWQGGGGVNEAAGGRAQYGGGAGGGMVASSSTTGTAGGDSIFGGGGGGSGSGSSPGLLGGAGGSANGYSSGGAANGGTQNAGNGPDGDGLYLGGGGGGGGNSTGGVGGNGGNGGIPSGGGGGGAAGSPSGNGGNGGRGQVVIYMEA